MKAAVLETDICRINITEKLLLLVGRDLQLDNAE